MVNRKHIRRHKTEYIFAGIACVTAIFGHNDIQRSMNSLSADRSRISESAAAVRILQENAETAKERAAIAGQRYKDGCTIVVVSNSPRNLASLVKGQPVLDRTSRAYLPEGTVVCDANGNTAILKNNAEGIPVADSFAFTGDRQLAINLIRKIHGARVFYNTPAR
ncbi:MAG: hypothetical protein PUP91_13775 [Rhizonema sp. PD37]|nr:hypothetical protein [Rhizonema sp. PD37]